jgi:hypothetical protein
VEPRVVVYLEHGARPLRDALRSLVAEARSELAERRERLGLASRNRKL